MLLDPIYVPAVRCFDQLLYHYLKTFLEVVRLDPTDDGADRLEFAAVVECPRAGFVNVINGPVELAFEHVEGVALIDREISDLLLSIVDGLEALDGSAELAFENGDDVNDRPATKVEGCLGDALGEWYTGV